MIKVLHIAKPVGGVGVYVALLSKFINVHHFSNEVACNFNDKNIALEDALKSPLVKHHINLERKISFYNDIKCLVALIKIVRKVKPDIIHCHSAKAGILGRLVGAILNIKTFYTPHAYSYLSSEGLKSKFLKSIERMFGYLPSKTLACSNSEYSRAVNDLNISKSKVLVWNNSIEAPKEIASDSKITDLKLPKDFICTIGRPSFQKNTELLIHAIHKVKSKLPNVHLVVLGVGLYSPLLENVNKLIKKLDLQENITLVAWIERKESLNVLNKCKLYVSSSRYEGLPYSLIEALSLSKPCVVTNVDGHKDLIKDAFNGFLVEQNSQNLANKILEILEDDNLLQKFSLNSKIVFNENFDLNKNIKFLEEIYIKSLQ